MHDVVPARGALRRWERDDTLHIVLARGMSTGCGCCHVGGAGSADKELEALSVRIPECPEVDCGGYGYIVRWWWSSMEGVVGDRTKFRYEPVRCYATRVASVVRQHQTQTGNLRLPLTVSYREAHSKGLFVNNNSN